MVLKNIYSFKIYLFRCLQSVLGEKLTTSLYKAFVFKNYLKAGIIFVHIPKTGGTSVAEVLYGRRVGHYTAIEIKQWLGSKKFESLKSVSLTRNPFQRLISAYNFVKNSGGTKGSIRQNPEFLRPEFEDFESFVKGWLVNQDPSSVDILFRPQYFFIYNEAGECLVKNVVKIENKKEIENILSEWIGRNIKLPKLNMGLGSAKPFSYSAEIKLLVFNFYIKDFMYFGYKFEDS